MKLNKLIILLVICVVISPLIMAETTSADGTNNRAQSGFIFLRLPVTARQVALEDSALTGEDGAMSAFVNISEIADLEGISLGYSNQNYYEGLFQMNNFALTAKVSERIGLAFSARSLTSQEMEVRTMADPEGESGLTYRFKDMAIGLGFGYRITKRFSIGSKVKFVNESIRNTTATTFLIDIATTYRLNYKNMRIIANFENFGPEGAFEGQQLWDTVDPTDDENSEDPVDNTDIPLDYMLRTKEFPAPAKIAIGLKGDLVGENAFFTSRDNLLVMSTSVIKTKDQFENFNFGLEYKYTGMDNFELIGRVGTKQHREEDYDAEYAFGAGVKYMMSETSSINLDYSYTNHEWLDQSHMMTIGFNF